MKVVVANLRCREAGWKAEPLCDTLVNDICQLLTIEQIVISLGDKNS